MVDDEATTMFSVFPECSYLSTKGLKDTNADTIVKCHKAVIRQLLFAPPWSSVELR